MQVIETTPAPLLTIASDTLPRSDVESAADSARTRRLEVRGRTRARSACSGRRRPGSRRSRPRRLRRGAPVGQLRNDADWRPRLQEAIAEACAVAEADGVALRAGAQWEIIEDMDPSTTTSAARDVAAGRPSELDAVVGGVLRAGERLGVETPMLRDLATRAGLA